VMDDAKLLTLAFMLCLQSENECDATRDGYPCRDTQKCGCWLEMTHWIDQVRPGAVSKSSTPHD